MSERVRLPAWVWHLERHYGQKVPQCPNCTSEDLYENYARACWHCKGCDYDISSHVLRWVPKDESARLPDEFSDPSSPPRYYPRKAEA